MSCQLSAQLNSQSIDDSKGDPKSSSAVISSNAQLPKLDLSPFYKLHYGDKQARKMIASNRGQVHPSSTIAEDRARQYVNSSMNHSHNNNKDHGTHATMPASRSVNMVPTNSQHLSYHNYYNYGKSIVSQRDITPHNNLQQRIASLESQHIKVSEPPNGLETLVARNVSNHRRQQSLDHIRASVDTNNDEYHDNMYNYIKPSNNTTNIIHHIMNQINSKPANQNNGLHAINIANYNGPNTIHTINQNNTTNTVPTHASQTPTHSLPPISNSLPLMSFGKSKSHNQNQSSSQPLRSVLGNQYLQQVVKKSKKKKGQPQGGQQKESKLIKKTQLWTLKDIICKQWRNKTDCHDSNVKNIILGARGGRILQQSQSKEQCNPSNNNGQSDSTHNQMPTDQQTQTLHIYPLSLPSELIPPLMYSIPQLSPALMRHTLQRHRQHILKVKKLLASHKQPEDIKLDYLRLENVQLKDKCEKDIKDIYDRFIVDKEPNLDWKMFRSKMEAILIALESQVFTK